MPEAGSDWTPGEVDPIVADYFDMLALELRGETFVKARRNAALQELTGRSRGSIEFKHQNISAVLLRLGMPWIAGYKPMANFQGALITGIERWLTAHPALFANPRAEAPATGFAEATPLFFEAPPVPSFEPVPPPLQRIVRKFDPALRDARNRALGKRGEERIFHHEQAALRDAGRADLARKVRWVSEEDGDGAGYDIRSFDPAGRERLIEVKTTVGTGTTPFFLSENERGFAEERPDAFRLARLYDFARAPRAFELTPPLDRCVMLRPETWRAEF
ncbi:DUF3883 domain-containing protein [Aurantimonas sp. MSK8Z-1]|uniref:DUF3883 domain-containing protein n=1 Tax=Mangrovibrevibacter kandeliae TaxID=2968473 RepID=UPI00211833F9|nr:DUF3883 domain-containing protein [Aurantimonas sp. MSK8Z-1]MCW4116280.1 DUF3883 domain-containing protein [Aurantimonas sp. MSK8Z-1]